ncbi:RimJ/RimL family protein N-acetyltransferase [Marisediminicola sp. UYEF4]|uniref:GNAT family N-acetyltransferase n=1 Tax=Marisediminicola sp. UYEF4 TaxID=1756384 RepID=UPI00339425C3
MTSLELARLTDVATDDLVALMTHPLMRRHMPLLGDRFTESDARAFVACKERLWAEHGYGPWAIYPDGRFAGWGGLQPEAGDADLARVLHPHFWGRGRQIYDEFIRRAFGEMGFVRVTALLPSSRVAPRALERLGFRRDGEVDLNGERFARYVLENPTPQQ